MTVVDASVFAFGLLDEGPTGIACREALTEDDRWIAPGHWTIELMSVVRGNLLGGRISAEQAEDAVEALSRLDPVVPRTRVLLPRVRALRGNLTAYDCALKTTDGRLARASGIRCRVDVIMG